MTTQLATSLTIPFLLLLPLAAACHSGSDTVDPDGHGPDASVAGDGDGGTDVEPVVMWTELTELAVDVEGGIASGTGGVGAAGGRVWMRSRQAVTIDLALPVASGSALPAVPTTGVALVAADLAADVTRADTIRVDAMLTSSGSDAVRIITSTDGDIVVTGKLRGADLGGATQSLVLRAPSGTIFVVGAVDTAGGDGTDNGDAAGRIELSARSVVITGQLLAAGEIGGIAVGGQGGAIVIAGSAGPVMLAQGSVSGAGGASFTRGGAGGAVAITASAALSLAGTIDTFGGDSLGANDIVGGPGGAITLASGADLALLSTVRLRGGAAIATSTTATGGAAGTLRIDSVGAARVSAIIDGRGGFATDAAGGIVTGGAAGSLVLGEYTRPTAVEIRAPLVATGGRGLTAGGRGGIVDLIATNGNLGLATTINVSGGASHTRPGNAGVVDGVAGPVGGGIRLSAVISGEGGAADGAIADGGAGAVVRLYVTSTPGDLIVTTTGSLALDGGSAAGTGRGGSGGDVSLKTRDGNASIAGQLVACGGDAQATGGTGGILELFTDANFNGVGGNLTIETSGIIDVSGGSGTIGGSARNNGTYGVASFPIGQAQLAVLLNTDGIHGSPQDGSLVNLGRIVALGGTGNGWGGDVMFHGRQPGSYVDPLPGMQSLAGDGTGDDGDFVAE